MSQKYKAKIQQIGDNNPSLAILESDFSFTVSVVRTDVGVYETGFSEDLNGWVEFSTNEQVVLDGGVPIGTVTCYAGVIRTCNMAGVPQDELLNFNVRMLSIEYFPGA